MLIRIRGNIIIISIGLVFTVDSSAFFAIIYNFCRSYISMHVHIEKFA